MITYRVRSQSLVDLYNDMKADKMVLAPHFQRKLVWRITHKVDFIKTILLGYPFPEIFLSRGTIDLDNMTARSYVVDGQQRLSSIREYVDGVFAVEGQKFSELPPTAKEAFLKYEIATIDLDLDKDDKKIIEIFQRLNRTFYALSSIEKLATEYASSEFMLIAKLLAGELVGENSLLNIDPDRIVSDPNLTEAFATWANSKKISSFKKYLLESEIFSKYEVSRQVHLMYVLNLLTTCLEGYYNRNDAAKRLLDEYSDNVPNKDELVTSLEKTAALLNKIKPSPNEFWLSKSNSFSLFIETFKLVNSIDLQSVPKIREALKVFAAEVGDDYRLAAREAVNNVRERTFRGTSIQDLLTRVISAK